MGFATLQFLSVCFSTVQENPFFGKLQMGPDEESFYVQSFYNVSKDCLQCVTPSFCGGGKESWSESDRSSGEAVPQSCSSDTKVSSKPETNFGPVIESLGSWS